MVNMNPMINIMIFLGVSSFLTLFFYTLGVWITGKEKDFWKRIDNFPYYKVFPLIYIPFLISVAMIIVLLTFDILENAICCFCLYLYFGEAIVTVMIFNHIAYRVRRKKRKKSSN